MIALVAVERNSCRKQEEKKKKAKDE